MVPLKAALYSGIALAALFSLPVLCDDPINPSFPYGTEKVRGVNLGGWLVLEVRPAPSRPPAPSRCRPCARLQPWITPSLFDDTGNPDIVDEWTFGALQDRDAAERALRRHWDAWITEADFGAIAAAG